MLKKDTQNNRKLKYSLIKQIGYGSFSEVYLAKDINNFEYAIKRINKYKLSSNKIESFIKELNISEILNHSNIVKCYETFKTNNYWYIVLEFCNFKTLHEHNQIINKIHISSQKENLVKHYLIQFKNSLLYLKNNNLVHRDLKPKNILFKINNNFQNQNINLNLDFILSHKNLFTLKLADFTFTKYVNYNYFENQSSNLELSVCGSPLYMAPELFINKTYNIKADLWSFGVIMYEMLFGFNPYISYGPQSVSNLSYIIQTKKIIFKDGYSHECYDLLKSLLIVNPSFRINWDDFFNHSWFKNSDEIIQNMFDFKNNSKYNNSEDNNFKDNSKDNSKDNNLKVNYNNNNIFKDNFKDNNSKDNSKDNNSEDNNFKDNSKDNSKDNNLKVNHNNNNIFKDIFKDNSKDNNSKDNNFKDNSKDNNLKNNHNDDIDDIFKMDEDLNNENSNNTKSKQSIYNNNDIYSDDENEWCKVSQELKKINNIFETNSCPEKDNISKFKNEITHYSSVNSNSVINILSNTLYNYIGWPKSI